MNTRLVLQPNVCFNGPIKIGRRVECVKFCMGLLYCLFLSLGTCTTKQLKLFLMTGNLLKSVIQMKLQKCRKLLIKEFNIY